MNIGALIGLILGICLLGFAAFDGATAQGVAMGKLWDPISIMIVVGDLLPLPVLHTLYRMFLIL